MPIPRFFSLYFFYKTLLFSTLIFVAGCTFTSVRIYPPKELQKEKIESLLRQSKDWKDILNHFSLPDRTTRVFGEQGLLEIRVIYQNLLKDESLETPPDLTVVFDKNLLLINYAWGDFFLAKDFPTKNLKK